ncbi:hypothetical protein DXB86_06410 [Collinsella sp. OM06-18AC]|nr:hypothetical protein DXB86_06410 [Collinsella sp. OM06-18AC]
MHDTLNIAVALKKATESSAIKLCPRESIEFEVRALGIIGGLAGGDSAKNPTAANIFPRNVQAFYRFGSILEPPPFRFIGYGVQPH